MLTLTLGLRKGAGTLSLYGQGHVHQLQYQNREEAWQEDMVCPGFQGKSECEDFHDLQG